MKFKFINKISVMQKKFLVFLTCSEGRIKHARGSDPARGLCIPAVYNIVTCTAFPYVTLHSQPFPITRLVAVLCCTCYFVPPNGLGALPICLCSCDAP